MTTTDTPRPTAPAIVCRPWCSDGDGHTNEFLADDQRCWSEWEAVPLSRMPLWEDINRGWNPQKLEVATEAGPRRQDAVLLYEGSRDLDLQLTAVEALAVAAALTKAAARLMDGAR
ncbi:hypothetical protein N866_01755 [Actinotalea ferrariae CF5-4]|uniref:Uncharacterized protein n=1 Tax=Actinotalea ferrariae CF5-4 TaxID=948458 RepID=A0A021VQ12_9CELL|nr:hypothetical protein [Actinotalea ferrariae]EYR63264.1 hypothetical protein N866_01755 [Actinotalea ferrariae CF5-4]